jgi:hypothetical protein
MPRGFLKKAGKGDAGRRVRRGGGSSNSGGATSGNRLRQDRKSQGGRKSKAHALRNVVDSIPVSNVAKDDVPETATVLLARTRTAEERHRRAMADVVTSHEACVQAWLDAELTGTEAETKRISSTAGGRLQPRALAAAEDVIPGLAQAALEDAMLRRPARDEGQGHISANDRLCHPADEDQRYKAALSRQVHVEDTSWYQYLKACSPIRDRTPAPYHQVSYKTIVHWWPPWSVARGDTPCFVSSVHQLI